jgi:uncharacterized lipoprotein NlpE involved in copper resistance
MKNILCFIFILALTACSGNSDVKNSSANKQVQLPENNSVTVFEGTLPCADCDGIKTTLTLFQNKPKNQYTYKLHEVYLGQNNDKAFETYGKWVALKGTQEDPNALVYQLAVQNEDPEDADVINYLIVNKNTIKLLDNEMNEFESKLNYSLTRKAN